MKKVAKIIDKTVGWEAFVGRHPGTGKAIKVTVEGFMPLCIECIGVSPHGPKLVQVSVAHYYEQNGDLMRDPDMVFDVSTSDDRQMGWRSGQWRPVSFRQDRWPQVFREAVFVEQGRVLVRPKLLRDLMVFARTWNRNLGEQGFVKVAQSAVIL
jgi:hypothetical protein